MLLTVGIEAEDFGLQSHEVDMEAEAMADIEFSKQL